MAELALKYSATASKAVTDTTLKKPIKEVNRMLEGIRVLCSHDSSNKIASEIWRIDPNSNSIICDKTSGMRMYLCTPYAKYLDVSTITKIRDVDDSNSVVVMTYLDPASSKNVTMNLSFPDEETCICFLKVIGYLISKARLDDAHHRQFEHLCRVFNKLDENNNGFLSFNELDKLYSRLRIHKKEQLFYYLFKKIQKESPKGMNTSEFILFHNHLYSLPDVELIFCTYAFSNGSINTQQFTRFLRNEQYEIDASPKEAQKILQELEVNEDAMVGLEFTLNGFINYIFDPHINGVNNIKFLEKPHQPKDLPLHYYFVKSCYVTASTSDEIDKNYQAAILKGYRHFELDVYLSQNSHSIFVSTSRESSARIEMSQLCSIFNEANLEHGPLILSMKLHLKTPQALDILTNTLLRTLTNNKLIFFGPDTQSMPNLDGLFNRVLIRSSIAYAQMVESSGVGESSLLFSNLIALDDVNFAQQGSDGSQVLNETLHGGGLDMTYSNAKANIQFAQNDMTNVIPEAGQEKWNHTVTFQAHKFAHMCDSASDFVLVMTSSYFVALSPRNSFQTCAPTLFWNYGVQSVFEPFPRHDVSSHLNDAFFKLNGNCGYCLKPSELYQAAAQIQQQAQTQSPNHTGGVRNSDDDNNNNNGANNLQYEQNYPVDNISISTAGQPREMINVKISVICGRFMPSLDIKPFVYLELYGPMPMYGATDVSESPRTVFKINPRYNNEFNFELPKSVYKQTFVAFSLWDNKALSEQRPEQILGRSAVHIANLRQGFRNVTLEDSDGKSLSPTSILIHVRKTKSRDYNFGMSLESSMYGN